MNQDAGWTEKVQGPCGTQRLVTTGLSPLLDLKGKRCCGYRDLQQVRECAEACLTGTVNLGQGAQPAHDNLDFTFLLPPSPTDTPHGQTQWWAQGKECLDVVCTNQFARGCERNIKGLTAHGMVIWTWGLGEGHIRP